MEKEWVDVVDNAVKIGLPAIVTGFVTVFGVRHSAKSSQDRFLLEHKVKLLEKLSDDVDSYFVATSMLVSKCAAIVKKMDHDEEEIELSKLQLSAIRERDKDLTESWALRQASLAKLRLLKASGAVRKLQDHSNSEYDLRNRLFFDKDYPNYNEISEIRSVIKEDQKSFHKELSDYYEKIAS